MANSVEHQPQHNNVNTSTNLTEGTSTAKTTQAITKPAEKLPEWQDPKLPNSHDQLIQNAKDMFQIGIFRDAIKNTK